MDVSYVYVRENACMQNLGVIFKGYGKRKRKRYLRNTNHRTFLYYACMVYYTKLVKIPLAL